MLKHISIFSILFCVTAFNLSYANSSTIHGKGHSSHKTTIAKSNAPVDANQTILNQSIASIATPHLFKTYYFNGLAKLIGFGSNHTPTTVGLIPSNVGSSPMASDLVLSRAQLTGTAELNDWITTVVSFAYDQSSPSFIRSPLAGGDTVSVEMAYVKIANPESTPLYIFAGRKVIPFGGPDPASILESPTYLLSSTRVTRFGVGFEKWHHLSGEIYGFKGLRKVDSKNDTHINSVGATVKYENKYNDFNYKFGLGYLNNITSATYTTNTVAKGSPLNTGFFHTPPSGLDVNAALAWRSLDASIKYIRALSGFSVLDLPITTDEGISFRGAKPAGWDLNLGYKFPVSCHTTRLALGYEGSKEAVSIGKASKSTTNSISGIYGNSYAIGIPYIRYYANYNINIITNADLTFEVAYDKGYSHQYGGTGKGAYTGLGALIVSV